jgi:hypothetical protein
LDDIDGENTVREHLAYSFSPPPDSIRQDTGFKVSMLRALSSEQRYVVRSLLAEVAESEISSYIRADAAKGVSLIDSLHP